MLLSLAILPHVSGGRYGFFTKLWLSQAARCIVNECAKAVGLTSPNDIHRDMQPNFCWNGQYFGFVAGGYLFESTSDFRGRVESDVTVWRSDRTFLGDLVGGEYVLL